MVYIALLRGVNVGGKSMVSMAALKSCFEQLGFNNVKTYINSGNVIFATQEHSNKLAQHIEAALDKAFDPGIRVLVKTREELRGLVDAIPATWVNDTDTKCDVMFLWPEADNPQVLEKLPIRAEVEDVRYLPGAVVWRIDRPLVTKSRMTRIVGTPIYKQMTIRNPNTVRKILMLANEID